ncbi:hypothetical protein FNB79_04125 [Formosa sediminum]|uniref:Uncharacterized protein n=1 Tax=Formosa sediminum TaxID=2594004 RepID=A0A516GNU6_9FLAO|nr:hypothetical protein [Formosa sediminum]QDO93196.1 hypothetical protein FNB79_04125 [Formosa sediminum]
MKNIYLVLGLIFVSTTVAFAQDRNEFKGPEYKNYKVWEHETTPKLIYTTTNKEVVTGPEFKNKKQWDRQEEKQNYTAITIGTERSKLKGPAYKNYKHWKKNN